MGDPQTFLQGIAKTEWKPLNYLQKTTATEWKMAASQGARSLVDRNNKK